MRVLALSLLCAPLVTACTEPVGTKVRTSSEVISGNHNGYAYKLFIPSSYRDGTAMPLVLMLHGCLQDNDQFAQVTRMNALAEQHGFLAVYPMQNTSVNPAKCWVWWEPASQQRGSGEPGFFASLVDKVRASYSVDPYRTHVAGFSGGAAAAVVLGAVYPDLFASIAVGSGLEFKAAESLNTSFPAMSIGGPGPAGQGDKAYAAMGPRARVVPVIVFHGTKDSTVNPVNGNQVLSQWAQTNDRADNGVDDDSITDTAAETETGRAPGGKTFTRTVYRSATGDVVMEKYLIDGMAHAWSGGASGSYSDPGGPDASALAWAFFQAHPLNGVVGTPDLSGAADLRAPVDMKEGAMDMKGSGADLLPAPDLGGGPARSVTLMSIGAEDGFAGAYAIDGAGAGVHKVGDKGMFNRDSYRLILSFDTSAVPAGATIKGARLRLTRRALSGAVSSLSLAIKSGAFGRDAGLAQEDYGAAASQSAIASAAPPAADEGVVEFTLPAAALSQINRGGRTQLRVSAATTASFAANTLQVYGGEDGAKAPALVIDYE
jgi:poly(hydroxyalkanoate) depolymerase family esterase